MLDVSFNSHKYVFTSFSSLAIVFFCPSWELCHTACPALTRIPDITACLCHIIPWDSGTKEDPLRVEVEEETVFWNREYCHFYASNSFFIHSQKFSFINYSTIVWIFIKQILCSCLRGQLEGAPHREGCFIGGFKHDYWFTTWRTGGKEFLTERTVMQSLSGMKPHGCCIRFWFSRLKEKTKVA